MNALTDQFADRRAPWPDERSGIVAAALAELAAGEPVDLARISARAGAPTADVLDFLSASPAEFDQHGRLVGFGITLTPTRHRLELDGRALYTWCAPDTLGFPALLGKRVRIQSPCFATGRVVTIEVDPSGILAVDPEGAVVSIVTANASLSDFRRRLCDQQHFFSSVTAAGTWQSDHPEAVVVPVRDGFALTRAVLMRSFAGIPSSCTLDEAGMSEQQDRYARLAASAERVERAPDAVEVSFDLTLDQQLLEEALGVERDCCPFFRFEFDRLQARLRITVEDASMVPALDAIAYAFGARRDDS